MTYTTRRNSSISHSACAAMNTKNIIIIHYFFPLLVFTSLNFVECAIVGRTCHWISIWRMQQHHRTNSQNMYFPHHLRNRRCASKRLNFAPALLTIAHAQKNMIISVGCFRCCHMTLLNSKMKFNALTQLQ